MASRDNIGLQVAAILQFLLIILLGVTCYFMWTSAKSERAKAQSLNDEVQRNRGALQTQTAKYQALKFMIQGGLVVTVDAGTDPLDAIKKQLSDALQNDAPGALSDDELKSIADDYYKHMAAFGLAAEEKRNYSNLPNYLITLLNKKNQEYATLSDGNRKLIQEKADLEAQLKQAQDQYKQTLARLTDEKQKLEAQFRQDRDKLVREKEQLATRLQQLDQQIAALKNDYRKKEEDYVAKIRQKADALRNTKQQLAEYEKPSFEKPDGRVSVVNHKLRLCYIDVGSDDGVQQQQTFSVYDADQSEVMVDRPKGSIEVVRVLGAHQTLCKIVDDDVDNLIKEHDTIYTPAWDPGRVVHFVLAGLMDVNDDGISDRALVEHLIKLNGGVIDDVVSSDTRFVVLGKPRGDKPGQEMTAREKNKYQQTVTSAAELGVDRISPAKLVAYMGWRGDIKILAIGDLGGEEGGLQIVPSRKAAKDPQAVIEDFKKELEWERKKSVRRGQLPAEPKKKTDEKATDDEPAKP